MNNVVDFPPTDNVKLSLPLEVEILLEALLTLQK
jgi:hypothetical protein